MRYTDEQIQTNLLWGNDIRFFYDRLDELEFNYVREKLSHADVSLKALRYDPDKRILEQIAELKGVTLERVEKLLGLESYRSYIYNDTYKQTIALLNDPKIPLREKERMCKLPLGAIMFWRALKMFVIGTLQALMLTIVFFFATRILDWMLVISLGFFMWGIKRLGYVNMIKRFEERIFRIATGGDSDGTT